MHYLKFFTYVNDICMGGKRHSWKGETPTTARVVSGFQERTCDGKGYLEAEEQEAERTEDFRRNVLIYVCFMGSNTV